MSSAAPIWINFILCKVFVLEIQLKAYMDKIYEVSGSYYPNILVYSEETSEILCKRFIAHIPVCIRFALDLLHSGLL